MIPALIILIIVGTDATVAVGPRHDPVARRVGRNDTVAASEDCKCKWNMEDDDMFYSSGDPVSVKAASAEECKKACCYDSHQKVDFECHAFTYEEGGLGCLVYQEVPKALNYGLGHTSGSLANTSRRCAHSASQCATTLRALCDSKRREGLGPCAECTGKNTPALQRAGCTQSNLSAFCQNMTCGTRLSTACSSVQGDCNACTECGTHLHGAGCSSADVAAFCGGACAQERSCPLALERACETGELLS